VAITEGHIHAVGLGLMLFSPQALAAMPAGSDFMHALEPGGARYATLVAAGRVVLLGTGSPQVDYRLRVSNGGAPAAEAFARTSFAMEIEDALAVRDGYAAMDWQIDDRDELRFPLATGRYSVEAAWVSCDAPRVDMAIDLCFRADPHAPPGDGWPSLELAVNRGQD
jgi:hypothetical protein